MGRLIQIAASTLLSGGILNHGSLGGYISNATRLALGMGLAELQDGQVHYCSRHHDLLKRAAIQVASQTAYGLLRSYPRYLKYWEQQVRDKYLQTQSQSSLANKTGQYYQLIREQQAVAQKKNHIDSIVGRTVADFLELSISEEGKYYDNSECKVLPNSRYGLVTFVDLGPQVQVSSRNNILLTRVQGRDYTRKEYISGVTSRLPSTARSPPNTRTCIPRRKCPSLSGWYNTRVSSIATTRYCASSTFHG